MERDLFKTLAAGKYAMSNLEATIDKDKMLAFIDGAIFAFDQLNKTKAKGGHNDTVEQTNDKQTHQVDG